MTKTCKFCGEELQGERKLWCGEACRHKAQRRGYHSRENPVIPQTRPDPSPDQEIEERELRTYETQVRREVGRTKILADRLVDAVKRFDPDTVRPPSFRFKQKRDPETMVVLRSDLHPGIMTPTYNLEVFHRRMELFTEKVLLIRDIISHTIPLTKLVIIDLGDNISGQDIFANQAWKSEKHVLEQIYHEAAPAIIRQDRTWLDYFPIVEEHSVPGNHGRTGKVNPEEVNFDNILAQEIAARFEFVDRYSIDVEWNWWKYVDIYGYRFLALHGSQLRGYLNIPFYNIITKGMRWQGSMPGGPWRYLLHGHWHVAFDFPWNNFHVFANGSLVSDDDFGLRELGMSSTPAQQVFGVHPDHGITWRYSLDLT